MALSTKIIKKRIRSIGNTRKITKAMEMVSTVKMRKAVQAVLATRPYAASAWEMMGELLARMGEGAKHPLLETRPEVKRSACIVITSNRGLCGGFNAQVLAAALRHAQGQTGIINMWIVVGKRGGEFLARNQQAIAAEFPKADVITGVDEISALLKMIITDFTTGTYDRVYVAYTDFISAMIQKPRIRQLLPLEKSPDSLLGSVGQDIKKSVQSETDILEFLFEPGVDVVLEAFLPHVVEIQLYQALLESTASEHSARMLTMKNASNAAADMVEELTLAFNQARQASITREIAEITGGKAALEQ